MIRSLLVVIWCVYHLIEYFGTTALWAMIGDLVPSEKRGRFLGMGKIRRDIY